MKIEKRKGEKRSAIIHEYKVILQNQNISKTKDCDAIRAYAQRKLPLAGLQADNTHSPGKCELLGSKKERESVCGCVGG